MPECHTSRITTRTATITPMTVYRTALRLAAFCSWSSFRWVWVSPLLGSLWRVFFSLDALICSFSPLSNLPRRGGVSVDVQILYRKNPARARGKAGFTVYSNRGKRKSPTKLPLRGGPALAVRAHLKPAQNGRWVASTALRRFQLPAAPRRGAGRPAVHAVSSGIPFERCGFK